jgi:hypothetical protein
MLSRFLVFDAARPVLDWVGSRASFAEKPGFLAWSQVWWVDVS